MLEYGFMGKILRVDLSKGKLWDEEIREDWAKKYLGGVGYATKLLYTETKKGIDPLGPENRLILMSGPLSGTASASASRYDAVFKSPLTGIWGHSNSGGHFGPALKRSGYDGIVFQGISPKPVYLKIEDGKAELKDAGHLWGKLVPETEDTINEQEGGGFTIASIGPAGENLVKISCIMNNKHRAAGRTGSGAVMGSKRLKAVACKGKAPIKIANEELFKERAKVQFGLINESMLKVGFETFGTNMVSDMVNERGGYPTRNWQTGVFKDIEKIDGQALSDAVLKSRVNCFACPIACGRGTEIKEGPWKGRKGEGPEYETVDTLGAMCDVSDINAITQAGYLCNEYGLDTISTGATIGFAMECYEKGILTKKQTGGLELNFGDGNILVELVEKIGKREGVGDLLAEGSRIAAQKLGKGAERFSIQVKGLELPAYDPRAAKICGLGYVTANRGGCHMTGYAEGPTFIDTPWLLVDDSKIADVFTANPKEAKVLKDLEDALTVFDCIGGCKFMGFLLKAEDYVDLIASTTGWDFGVADFRATGERVYNLIRAYCVREGITRADDVLPARLMEEPLPEGNAKGMVIDEDTLEMMKDAYYDYRGWDKKTGKPSTEKLKELGLEDLIKDMWGK